MELPIVAVDVETSVKCPVGNNKASPHWPENRMVVGKIWPKTLFLESVATKNSTHVLVAHNAPFDLQWLYRWYSYYKDSRCNIKLWDTGVAEYLLTGQKARWPSLDSLCSKYGLPLKEDKFKAHWESGGQTEDLPIGELSEYCEQDAKNTHAIASKQMALAAEQGLLPLMRVHMDASLAITDMMNNGMKVDKVFLENACTELSNQLARLRSDALLELASQLREDDPDNAALLLEDFDLNSPQYLSKVLYGGKIKSTSKQVVGTYKNGRPKFRNVDTTTVVCGLGYEKPIGSASALATDEDSLNSLSPCPFLKTLAEYRKVNKDYSTYFAATNNLVMPDGCVHHSINNTATVTGRLSSSEPNLQNVTRGTGSNIKRAYISRWGNQGYLVEADYKQLEIVALAALSGDKQLTQDVRDGVDVHTALYKQMYGGKLPNDEERTEFKRLSFALIYGAGASSMAKNAGVDLTTAKAFQRVFHSRYPDAYNYWLRVQKNVLSSRTVTTNTDPEDGHKPIAVGKHVTPTGRTLHFRDYKNKYTGGRTFSKSEMSNYPVQSFATGDCVPLGFGRLFRALTKDPTLRDKCLLVNTVHDSVLLDVHEDVLDKALPVIKSTLENVPQYLKDVFDYDFVLPTKVDIKYGRNWKDLTEKYV